MPKLLRGEFVIHDKDKNKSETFPMTPGDMECLRAGTDLNDTIIANYIKLMQFVFLPPAVEQASHIFSSFFLEKLISEILKDDNITDYDNGSLVEFARERVRENYKNVKRWTKKIDIFGKDILVVPINAFKHWFTVFVLRPHSLLTNSSHCQIVYCDSMMEQREFIVEAVRKYLQYELE
jgi:sentrin-specific protease 7